MTVVHVYRPSGRYIAQIRRRGARRWTTIGKPKKDAKAAMTLALRSMTSAHKRARVLFCTEWHDPNIVMELTT